MEQDALRKRYVSWEEVNTALADVQDMVAEKNYQSLFGIPRGGLIVALLLSYKTGLPLVYGTRDIGVRTLIVDDIVDRGATLQKLFENCGMRGPNARPDVFALFFRARDFALAFPAQDAGDAWIVFPWEDDESSRYDGTFNPAATK